jgi:hypothetical protein
MKSSTMALGLWLGMATASAFSPATGVSAMTADEFAAVYPLVLDWIQQTIAKHEHSGKIVGARGFKRLPLYFSQELLNTTKVVTVSRVPIPPLSSMGLHRFGDFERGDFDGVTYLHTYFIKRTKAADEELHFHELIHIVQWQFLGPERFLKLYADGLERYGYQDSPLERMAYAAQAEFSRSKLAFDAQTLVLHELRKLSAL